MNLLKRCGGWMADTFRATDKLLIVLAVAASTVSCILIASLYPESISSYMPVIKQAIGSVAGLGIAIILSTFDYHNLVKLWKIFAPAGLLLCLLVFTPLGGGRENVSGADDRNWLFSGTFFSFQPSEFLKAVFILTFALHIATVREHINRPRNLLLLLLHAMVPVGLIMAQGDYGTMLVFVFIFVIMLFVGGVNWKVVLGGVAIGAAGLVVFWYTMMPTYLKNRFSATYNLEATRRGDGMQQWLGRMTLGSGGLFGKGINSDDLLTSTPELYNDMMFAHIGQVFGFVGCFLVVVWAAALCLRLLQNGRNAEDALGNLICVGVFAVILSQSIINIGMVLCLTPVIGVTLPLFSSGMSSVLGTYILLGLALSVHNHTPKTTLF